MDPSLLHIENLSLTFDGEKHILTNLSLSIPPATIISLIGPSGSGKSQLAKAIMKLYDEKNTHVQGHIVWCDAQSCTDFVALSDAEMNHYRGTKIGMVFQDPRQAFNPQKKCGLQVQEVLQTHFAVSSDVAKTLVVNLFKRLKLDDAERIYNAYPHELSGGQLQRVAIAAAVINKPALIIADEATSALDKDNEAEITALLLDYVKSYNCALLWISHDLPHALNMSSYNYVLDNGQVVDEGIKEAILLSTNLLTKNLLAAKYKRSFFDKADTSTLLSINGVNKSYGSNRILNDFHLLINYGERVGVYGPSGKGKSTVGKIIAGIEKQDKGEIIWLDKNGSRLNTMSQKIQMVFQHPMNSFNPKMSIGKSLEEAIQLAKGKTFFSATMDTIFDRNPSKHIAIEHLSRVGLGEQILALYPHQLSGGELQKVAIARTLIFNPVLLILDEAVTALDSISKKQILTLLDSIQNEQTIAYLFISHDEALVDEFCEKKVKI